MRGTPTEFAYRESYPGGIYELSDLVKSLLDQEIACLPPQGVSEHQTRYPTSAASMRAFLEVFFTRHLFQVQNSLMDYATSADLHHTLRCGCLSILDIGSGPAVASQALIDLADRMMGDADPIVSQCYGPLHMSHVLNDTSSICLTTGKHMLTAYLGSSNQSPLPTPRPRIFPLLTAFPGNLHQIRHLASFLGGFDLVVLSYVLRPLSENENLTRTATGVAMLERFCKPRGRMLIVQDKFQEPLIRRLACTIDVECREQTLTQEIYPPRGTNETCTYTYYDCLYAPRMGRSSN
jgi:hypothetical protein